jgi:hypothetical protein
MSEFIAIFDTFMEYPDKAPKDWSELDVFIDQCRLQGFETLADYLIDWKESLDRHAMSEMEAKPLHGPYGYEGYCYCGTLHCDQWDMSQYIWYADCLKSL